MTEKEQILIVGCGHYPTKNLVNELIKKEKVLEANSIFKINRGKGKAKNRKDRWN